MTRRLIARIDVKGTNAVKGIAFEGLRVVGTAQDLAVRYAKDADELLIISAVASNFGTSVIPVVESIVNDCFVPVTVGGGIRSMDDIKALLDVGADRVAINTWAIKHPDFITQAAIKYGAQAIIVGIEAKRVPKGWEAYTDNGRECTGRGAVGWAIEAAERGAGEILVTSVDQDGTKRGCDVNLIAAISKHVDVPVIASGGVGNIQHVSDAFLAGADSVAVGSVLHYGVETVRSIKLGLENCGHNLRPVSA